MENNNEGNWPNQPPNDFEIPIGLEPPFNADHGFRRLRFADINIGERYVIKRVEKFKREPEVEWTYDTVYFFIRVVEKTEDEVIYNTLFTRGEFDAEWEFNMPDPDLEEFPEDSLGRILVDEVITEEVGGGLTVKTLHHFYVPEPEANALSNASSTFSGNTLSVGSTNEGSTNNSNANSVISTASAGGKRRRKTKNKSRKRRNRKTKNK